ncbi:metal ABC transporter permease [Synechocystis salina LEGE 06155]|uniref:Metal ABC transporter permease n=2 Tax=Synechocystis TaxID=1142 RepID=A0ABR9VW64_9SYNC|nr:metal ABC transporter permease [Synechocystis salina LEGE 06155]MBE9241641.1 metal ABC transporter permease [Synechocystis salina LEGE 00041]MBE9255602.1 metal ABC transporter permease [Synechocystis salina LEGE 00031]
MVTMAKVMPRSVVMIEALTQAWQYEFMQNAVLASLLVSLACGLIGSFIVINRMVFISGGVAHAAYGGIGLGYYFAFNPLWGAFGFSLVMALAMGWVARKYQQRSDTLIGVMWALGMAIGIMLIDLTKGYKADVASYLFGSILTVPRQELWLMAGLDLLIVILLFLLYKEFLAISFDPVYATTRNLPVDILYLTLVAAIALTVVMVMQLVGLIMVIALLSIPAAIAGQYVRDVPQMMALASGLGMVFCLVGLALSYSFNLSSGATIILVASIAYLISLAFKR